MKEENKEILKAFSHLVSRLNITTQITENTHIHTYNYTHSEIFSHQYQYLLYPEVERKKRNNKKMFCSPFTNVQHAFLMLKGQHVHKHHYQYQTWFQLLMNHLNIHNKHGMLAHQTHIYNKFFFNDKKMFCLFTRSFDFCHLV
jgi:hypothetical protein